tara:strand:+ start:1002 stop:1457 length:456 start_codon:yes stop_codon:yes gene_type:complete
MKNHFEIFNINPRLDLNMDFIEEKYLELQLKSHPDLMINKSPEEQQKAANDSSNINNAYEILKDPLKRAIYFLEINNIFIDSIKPDNMLLMEIMEIKEEFEMADKKKREVIKKDLKNKIDLLYQEITALTNKNNIAKAGEKIVLLKYLSKL